jgi:phosphatidylinositol glycan class O
LQHVFGLYLFASGFLLTRLVLDNKSECQERPSLAENNGLTFNSYEEGCWYPKQFEKAVVIIVDALRYDFTVPFKPKDSGQILHHYHNALPLFYDTAVAQPHYALLLPFIADPPTSTLQRLKGLTTGTLPTFIDIGTNFAGTAIEEDNLVVQLRNASKRVVQLGDDTWHALFPGLFEPNLTKPYDSFNVWDLHTVDNGVTEHLLPLLQPANTSKWDIVFGHYLGVDHAGHRYGPDHPAMAAKLQQMDAVFRQVMELIDDQTLLVVMGDHGMDAKGDHGGESEDEVEAAIWMYSKRPVFGRFPNEPAEPPMTAKDRPIAQIDLVPTLALLLGLPIPFNNLGAPIKEVFLGTQESNMESLARAYQVTTAQIHRYMEHYVAARRLDASITEKTQQLWSTAVHLCDQAIAGRVAWEIVYHAFSDYQMYTLAICRSLWARFDIPSMLHGIEVLTVALIVLIIYACGIKGDTTELIPLLFVRGGIGTIFGALVGATLGYIIPSFPIIHSTVYCSSWGGDFGIFSALYIFRRRLTFPRPKSTWSILSILCIALLSIGFASNSYTIWEDQILLFFLCTFACMMFISSLRQENVADRALGAYHSALFILFARVASFSRLCREEQMPYCISSYYASSGSSTSAAWQLIIPYLISFLLPLIVKQFYQNTNSFYNSAETWLTYAFRFGLSLSASFWTLDAADDNDWFMISEKDALKTIKVTVAQIVLSIAFAAGYSTYAWAGPFFSLRTLQKETPHSSEETKGGQDKKGRLKGNSNTSSTNTQPQQGFISENRSSVTQILGYMNAQGSRYFILPTIWTLGIILLQKPMGSGAIALELWQILSLLEILHANNLKSSSVGPIILALLGSFHFFKTGHQATLSSIQWESAFIPLRTIRYPWSPIFVMLNTFGAHILAAVSVPAISLWRSPPRKQGMLNDVAKAVATHVLFYATLSLATAMWAGWLRRHLMLYRIFSPRFMMAAAVLIVVEIVSVFVAVGGVRWSIASNAEVFGYS